MLASPHGGLQPLGKFVKVFDGLGGEQAGGVENLIHPAARQKDPLADIRRCRRFHDEVFELADETVDREEAVVLAGFGKDNFAGEFSSDALDIPTSSASAFQCRGCGR